jgi:hypothetical protein
VNTSFSIYPNPVETKFKFDLTGVDGTGVEMEIRDKLGRLVLSKSYNVESGAGTFSEEVDVDILTSGVYTVKMIVGQETILHRLTKL